MSHGSTNTSGKPGSINVQESDGSPAGYVTTVSLLASDFKLTVSPSSVATIQTGRIYDPDRPPTTGLDTARSDEFYNGASATWSSFNSGPTSFNYDYGVLQMQQNQESRNARGRYIAASGPISSDFSVYTKVSYGATFDNESAGLIVLDTGNWSTPTKIWLLYLVHDSGSGYGTYYLQTRTAYNGAPTTIDFAASAGFGLIQGQPIYFRMKYTASSKAAVFGTSFSGMPGTFRNFATQTLTAHPEIGAVIDAQAATGGGLTANWHFWRVFQSGVNSATSAQYSGDVMGA